MPGCSRTSPTTARRPLLGKVRCPILVIHGDNDEEERRLLEVSRRGLRFLPEGSRLEVIHGADHSFVAHFDRVIELGVSWLAERLPADPPPIR